MKQRVVFLFYHGFGHVNPCFELARILEAGNYEVYFAGVRYFHSYVLSQGFSYYPLKSIPFGLSFETWVNSQEKKRHVYFSSLKDRITDRLYKDRKIELLRMLDELKPHTILIDSVQATDFIVLYAHLKRSKIKVAILHAMFPTHVLPGRPPVNSVALPHKKNDVKKALRLMKWQRLKKSWKKKFQFFGFDEQLIIRRRVTKNAIPPYYTSKTPSLLNYAVQHIDEFILAPREFDFPDFVVQPNQHYIGFLMNKNRVDQSDPEYVKISPLIYRLKERSYLNLIYCSFGTIELKAKNIILSFLERLINVAISQNYLLLISLKAQAENVGKFKTAKNVFIFNSVPQLEVLSHADLFVTHGGLNSIKEAVHAEVPMLMYPIHSEYDPKGNSARIEYHGLGLRGNADFDTEAKIKEKIIELLSNAEYKRRVQELKNKNLLNTPQKFLEIFNSIKPLSV